MNTDWLWINLAEQEKGKAIMARISDEELFGAYSPLRLIKKFPNGIEVHWDQEKNVYFVGRPGKLQFQTFSKEIALATAEGDVFANGRGNPLDE